MQLMVPLDLDHPIDAVVDLAVRAAGRLQADVHLLTVVSPQSTHETFQLTDAMASATAMPAADNSGGLLPYPGNRSRGEPQGTMVETRTQAATRVVDTADDRLAALARRFGARSVAVKVLVDAHIAAAIAAYAREQSIDLVVMGTHARGGLRRSALGSVAEAVIRGVTAPVLLAGPHWVPAPDPAVDLGTLIVCVDGSEFAEAILPLAAWVRRLQMRVVVVTVVKDGGGEGMPNDVLEDSYVHRVAEGLRGRGVDAQWDVLHGSNPAQAISDYVAAWPGSVAALATHARTGLPRLLSGSVAMNVAHTSINPVLVLHPSAPQPRTVERTS
jgi:nucleotide-binding universal stress UspA family protein